MFLEHKLARERPRHRLRVAREHGGRAAAVVVADERVGDDEAALGHGGTAAGSGTVGSSFATWSYAR